METATKTIKLQFPIKTSTPGGASATIESVEIRRLKGKDLKFLPSSDPKPADFIPLISSVTGMVIKDVEEMDLVDLTAIGKDLMAFSAGYPE